MGLGFGFSATDSGLLDFQKQVSAGFDDISARMASMGADAAKIAPGLGAGVKGAGAATDGWLKSLNTKATNSLGGFGRAAGSTFGFVRTGIKWAWITFDFFMDALKGGIKLAIAFGKAIAGAVADKIGKMTDAVLSSNTNITTSTEAMVQHNTVATKALAANYGMTGKQAKQAAGLFLSQGTAADVNAAAVYGLSQAQGALGMTAAELAKMSTITGVNAAKLGGDLGFLTNAFQGDKKAAKEVFDTLFIGGKIAGDVGGTLGNLGGIAKRAQQHFENWHDAGAAKSFALQTARMVPLFRQVSGSAAEASALTDKFADNLLESGKEFQGLFSGVGTELAKTVTSSATAQGKLGSVVEEMKSGPQAFLAGFRKVSKELGPEEMEQFKKMMVQQLGSSGMGPEVAAALSQLMTLPPDKLAAAEKGMRNAGKLTGKALTDGWQDNRTPQELFELSMGLMMKRIRAIGAKETNAALRDAKKAARAAAVELEALAKNDDFVGDFAKKAAQMHRIGISALLPEKMQGKGMMAQLLVKEFDPVFETLGKLGISARDVFSPTGLLTGGIVVAAHLAAKYGDNWEKFGNDFEKHMKPVMKEVVAWTDKLPAIGRTIGKGLEMALEALKHWGDPGPKGPLSEGASRIFSNLAEFAQPVVKGLVGIFNFAFERLLDWMDKQDWAGMFNKLLAFMGKAIHSLTGKTPTELVTGIGKIFVSAIIAGLSAAMSELGDAGTMAKLITGGLAAVALAPVSIPISLMIAGYTLLDLAASALVGDVSKAVRDKANEAARKNDVSLNINTVEGRFNRLGENYGVNAFGMPEHDAQEYFKKLDAFMKANLPGKLEQFNEEVHRGLRENHEITVLDILKWEQESDNAKWAAKQLGNVVATSFASGVTEKSTLIEKVWANMQGDAHVGRIPATGGASGGASAAVDNLNYGAAGMMGAEGSNAAYEAAQKAKADTGKMATEVGEGFYKSFVKRAKTSEGATRMMTEMTKAFKKGTEDMDMVLKPWFSSKEELFKKFAKDITDVVATIITQFTNAKVSLLNARATVDEVRAKSAAVVASPASLTLKSENKDMIALHGAIHQPAWVNQWYTVYRQAMQDLIDSQKGGTRALTDVPGTITVAASGKH